MSSRYRVIIFLIVILLIILLTCSCIPSMTSIKEGNSCGDHGSGDDEKSDLEKCQDILASGEVGGGTEWNRLNCDELIGAEGFSLLNPMRVINGETQSNESKTGLNLSEYNSLIINESSKTPSNSSCLNHDMGLMR